MIKFFRKIRKNLLIENKTGKYFKYAIGEIVLVVIGILIALQINNWKESRINSTKEHEYLIGLKNDLEKQIEAFIDRDNFYNLVINKGEDILIDFGIKGSLIDIDSINSKLSTMMYSLKYPDIKTTFIELNTTGQINLIKNESLRSYIIKYYQNSEVSKQSVNSNIDEVYYNHIFPFIKSSIIIHPENFGKESDKINKELINKRLTSVFKDNLSNPSKEFEIINAINLRVVVAKTNKSSIQTATTNAEGILNLINKELENN